MLVKFSKRGQTRCHRRRGVVPRNPCFDLFPRLLRSKESIKKLSVKPPGLRPQKHVRASDAEFLKSKTHKIERASRTKTCNPKLKHKSGQRQQRKV